MNILYFCDRNISPLMGGTERITISVSNALRTIYGIKSFLAFVEDNIEIEPAFFDGRIRIDENLKSNDILKFINQNQITHIIVQNSFMRVNYFRSIIGKSSNVKIIFCYHFAPGWDLHFDISSQVKKIWRKPGAKNKIFAILKYFYFSVAVPIRNIKYPSLYRKAYNHADKVVLLSDKFIDGYKHFARLISTKKICGIPNMLSFPDFLPESDISSKRKNVLIVARLDEEQKRISYALKVWRIVKQDKRSKDWRLQIIGSGDNEKDYKNYVEKYNLDSIEFLGRQNPSPYYKKASIFMLTSRSEGWGLTLTESQQFGVVPVAFYSYESLVDIIDSGKNGYIIKDEDILSYAEKILELMDNNELRNNMARNAINSAHRFEQSVIAHKWKDLFEKING